jgi:hypothetical protein
MLVRAASGSRRLCRRHIYQQTRLPTLKRRHERCLQVDEFGGVTDMPVKILLVGPVAGKLDTLVKRINSATSKAGPFAGVFCVGQFFEDGDAGADCPAWFQACIDGTPALPAPVYFVGGDGVLQAAHPCCACWVRVVFTAPCSNGCARSIMYWSDTTCILGPVRNLARLDLRLSIDAFQASGQKTRCCGLPLHHRACCATWDHIR